MNTHQERAGGWSLFAGCTCGSSTRPRDTDSSFEPGDIYTCRGPVKEHSEFHGVKSTKLSRCKLRIIGPVPKPETFEDQMTDFRQ